MSTTNGRKYGRGKYGASTYDLGLHPLPPWIGVKPPPIEVWGPIPEEPPWCDIPPHPVGPEIWVPKPVDPLWCDPPPTPPGSEIWGPIPISPQDNK